MQQCSFFVITVFTYLYLLTNLLIYLLTFLLICSYLHIYFTYSLTFKVYKQLNT